MAPSLEGGRDSHSVETWRQRVHKETRAVGVSAMFRGEGIPPREHGIPEKNNVSLGASKVTVYASVMSSTPRGGFFGPSPPPSPMSRSSPRSARPHMQHHFGYGWGESPSKELPFGSNPLRGSETFRAKQESLSRQGDRVQQSEGLQMSPHPFLKPSQRLHGNVMDAGLQDTLPPRASRKPPLEHRRVKKHDVHFLSWPGHSLYVPKSKHYYKPQVDSHSERRGELPPTAQMLITAGSRPGFPVFGYQAKS